MCIVNEREETLTEDKTVYKVFTKGKNGYYLPFRKVNNKKFSSLKFVTMIKSDKPGYHCFNSYDLAEEYRIRSAFKTAVIIEFKIPKGTTISEGTISNMNIGGGMKCIATPILTEPRLTERIKL